MSLSLHSSTEALTSSKRGSEKDSDIEPEKSSIGEISSRIPRQTTLGIHVAGVGATLRPLPGTHQPLERLGLQIEQVGYLERLADLRE
jgi:hypothetical protein